MSICSVLGSVCSWVSCALRTFNAGQSCQRAVEVARDDSRPTVERVALTAAHGISAGLQLADIGMDMHAAANGGGNPGGTDPQAPIPESSSLRRRIVGCESEGSSNFFNGTANSMVQLDRPKRRIVGSQSDSSPHFSGKNLQDTKIRSAGQHALDSKQSQASETSPSSDYTKFRMELKVAKGVARVGTDLAERLCRPNRHGLDIHDYYHLLAQACSQTGSCLSFASEAYPESYSQTQTKTIADNMIFFSELYQKREELERFGAMVRGCYNRRTIPASRSSTSSLASSSSIPGRLASRSAISKPSTSEPSSVAGPSEPRFYQMSNLEIGQSMYREMHEVWEMALPDKKFAEAKKVADSIGDVAEAEKIPDYFKEDPVIGKYCCAITGRPIRRVMMVQTDAKSVRVYYEREALRKWFHEHPHGEKPKSWPAALQDWGWSEVEEFNKLNLAVEEVQDEINERLRFLLNDLKLLSMQLSANPQKGNKSDGAFKGMGSSGQFKKEPARSS